MPESIPSSPSLATADAPRAPLFFQADLIAPSEVEIEPAPDVKAKGKVFTGTTLKANDPARYAEIVRLLGQGASYRSIRGITGVNHYMVEAVEAREWPTVEQQRKLAAVRARKIATMGMERISELLEDDARVLGAAPRDLGYLVDIATKNAELLSGGVTERREIVRAPAPAADQVLDDYLRGLPQAEVEETGSPAPETRPARATLPAPEPFTWPADRSSPEDVPVSTIDRATDSESDGKPTIHEDSGQI